MVLNLDLHGALCNFKLFFFARHFRQTFRRIFNFLGNNVKLCRNCQKVAKYESGSSVCITILVLFFGVFCTSALQQCAPRAETMEFQNMVWNWINVALPNMLCIMYIVEEHRKLPLGWVRTKIFHGPRCPLRRKRENVEKHNSPIAYVSVPYHLWQCSMVKLFRMLSFPGDFEPSSQYA